jgi:octaprenyl-diphosphate synthase
VRRWDDEQEVLDLVERRIRDVVIGAPGPVRDIALHLVDAGGKRVRPKVVVHASRVGGTTSGAVVDLATAAELMHNASLLHDDVIDEAPLRRGRPSARKIWGNAHSVLAGDHLMTCALQILESSEVPGVLKTMLVTMRRLVAAEVVQLAHRGRLLPDREHYYQVVKGKTAALFCWCAEAGARAGGADDAICQALAEYGEEAGMAFQLFDDLLDLSGSTDEMGKSLLSDIAQGVATLPVVLAAQAQPHLVEEILAGGGGTGALDLESLVVSVRHWVEATGAGEETRRLAREHITRAVAALHPLGDGPHRDRLEQLARTMIDRRS